MLKKLAEVIGDEIELPVKLLADGEITRLSHSRRKRRRWMQRISCLLC